MKSIKVNRKQIEDNRRFEKNISNDTPSFIFLIDLALLFKLVSRVPNATLELKRIVEDHIRQMGIDAIERVSATAINVSYILSFVFISYSSNFVFCNQDPKLYVETILDIHSKFFKLVQEAFSSEQGFTAALDKVNNIYS
jgi:cullin 1